MERYAENIYGSNIDENKPIVKNEPPSVELMKKTTKMRGKIPIYFTYIVLILGFFNLGSAIYQYYASSLFTFLEITQGLVGVLMILVSIFLIIKINYHKRNMKIN